jgi:hypothetical protein
MNGEEKGREATNKTAPGTFWRSQGQLLDITSKAQQALDFFAGVAVAEDESHGTTE